MRFSLIEMKVFLYILLTNFTFEETGEKIIQANVYVRLVLNPSPLLVSTSAWVDHSYP